MKPIKRILSGALAAVMISASASFISSAQVTFTDVNSHWAKNYISYLVDKDVLNGYKQDDGSYMFKPEDTVTRAEFIKMLDETFGLVDAANITGKYNDVTPNDWFYSYFAKAAAQGYIHNYGTTATPNGALSREEATSLLVRYLDLPDSEKVPTTTFADYNTISYHYNQDVLKAAKASLINGYKENNGTYTFRPQNTLTRAEALTILYRAAGAIFTYDRSNKDAAAYESNAVIKTGGITLENQTLNGRVILSEGADNGTVFFRRSNINDTLYIRGGANITLESTKVNTIVVDSPDIVNITLQNNSSVENVIINERCSMMIGSGTSVGTLTAEADADYIAITGTGTIKKAYISSAGFSSTMVPHEFEIFDGCTASFASKEYQGTSGAQVAFLNTPFMTLDNNVHCINVLPLESGTIRYYFANNAYCPGISDFDSYYFSAAYKSSVEVRGNTSVTEPTYNASYVKSFGYIVLQLEADGRYFPPVLIPNKDSSGSGFTVNPTLKNASTITYTANDSGTIYYMYAAAGDQMNTNDFLIAYNDQSGSLKGESNAKNGTVTINSKYAEVNHYMIFMFKDSEGLYYSPVVVALGDDGFSKDPVVVTPGTIEFTPSVSGTVYYYFSETADLPAPDKFNSAWRTAEYSYEESVTKSKATQISYRLKYADEYSYIILCLRSGTSENMLPVALKIDYEPGFESMPEVIDETTIRFEPEDSGKVKYYYAKKQTAPSPTEFETIYADTSSKLKGTEKVYIDTFTELTYDPAIASDYGYMVIMLEDSLGNDFQPVVVSLMTTANTGFITTPYVYGDNIYFKTEETCEVWYYYSRTNDIIPMSDFYEMWDRSYYGYTTSAYKGSLKSVELDKDLLDNYPYIIFATSKSMNSDISTYPVTLNAEKEAENDSSTAIKVTRITSDTITLTTFADGTLFYYETDTSSAPSKNGFENKYMATESKYRGMKTVHDASESTTITVSGDYKYIVLQIEGEDSRGNEYLYETVVVNTKNLTHTGDDDYDDDDDDTTTASGYGFSVEDLNPTQKTLTIAPNFDGTLIITLANEDYSTVLSSKEYVVHEGTEIDLDYPAGNGTLGGMELFLFVQLIDEDGVVHKRYGGIELVP